ncbi:MAG: ChaN family lipoprotein [Bdellovibrio bacteriovorus]
MNSKRSRVIVLCLSFLGSGGGAASSAATDPLATDAVERVGTPAELVANAIQDTQTRVLDPRTLTDMERLIDTIADRRVVFVGESHDRYEDHLNQLAVIEGLHRRGKDLAIGMEFFQQPFQGALDAFVAGEIDEAELLRRTEYFDRWRYDYRLYRPILRFAREHGIPVLALNLESELTEKVGQGGIGSLTPEEQARIPVELDREDSAYRARVKQVFDMHPTREDRSFEHFLEVQLLWDEGMADQAARYLSEHPGKTLVVLAGAGHVEYGQGIPKRVLRRVQVPAASLLNGSARDLDPEAADFLLYPRRVELPATGLLGIMLGKHSEGEGARVQGFAEGSGAKAAGLREGDRIVRVGEHPVSRYADIRIALIDSRPGQRLPVEVRRTHVIGADEELTFEVELKAH